MRKLLVSSFLVIAIGLAYFPVRAQSNVYAIITSENASYLEQISRLGEIGHAYNMAWSPDGQTLAVATSGGLLLYETTSWEAHVFHKMSAVRSLAFHPDGNRVALGYEDGRVEIWNRDNWTLVHSFTRHASAILSITFSPDGKLLAVGSGGYHPASVYPIVTSNLVRVWNVESGDLVQSVSNSPARDLVFNGGGTQLAILTTTGFPVQYARNVKIFEVSIHDVQTGNIESQMNNDPDPLIWTEDNDFDRNSIAFGPAGNWVVISSDNKTEVWTPETDDLRTLFDARTTSLPTSAVELAADGSTLFLVVAHTDNTHELQVWDTTSWQVMTTANLETDIEAIAISPDAEQTALLGSDGQIYIYDVASQQVVNTLNDFDSVVAQISFSQDSQWLGVARSESGQGNLQLYATTDFSTMRELSNQATDGMVFTSDQLTAIQHDASILVWKEPDFELTQTILQDWIAESRLNITVTPDGRFAAVGDSTMAHDVVIWNLNSSSVIDENYTRGVFNLQFSPDGRLLSLDSYTIGFNSDGTLNMDKTYDLWSNSMWGGGAVVYLPSGEMVAATDGSHIGFWRFQDGEPFIILNAPLAQVADFTFNPSGNLLLAGYTDGTVRVLSFPNGEELARLTTEAGEITSVAFSPDGTLIGAGTKAGIGYVWAVKE